MCGINGIIRLRNNIDISELNLMNEIIKYRGPDDQVFDITKIKNNSVGIAMTRLAIVDVKEGKQPFVSSCKNYKIVFNGEIYNYLELRKLLENKNITFETNSDTEVLFKGLIEFGYEWLEEIKGMFSFSFLNFTDNTLMLGRDYFGEKPLYYHRTDNQLTFSSSVNSIKSASDKLHINSEAILEYLNYSYTSETTIYDDLFRVKPNSIIQFSLNDLSVVREVEIKSPKLTSVKNDIKYLDLINNSLKNILTGIERKTSFLLSGGIDSSLITALVSSNQNKKIECFTASSSDKKLDETSRASSVAKMYDLKHYIVNTDTSINWKEFEKIINNMSEPFGDSSLLSSYSIYKELSKNFTVAVGGDGGDEVFFGYNKYKLANLNKYIKIFRYLNIKFIWKSKISYYLPKFLYKALRILTSEGSYSALTKLGVHEATLRKYNINWIRKDELSREIFGIKEMREIDLKHSLPNDMLFKADYSSMLNSIELRSPLLDKTLFTNTSELLIKSNKDLLGKKVLKELAKEYLPPGFTKLSKKGFEFSKHNWLSRKDIFKNISKLDNTTTNKLVDDIYSEILTSFTNNSNVYAHDMYIILILKMWLISNEENRNSYK